MHMDTIPRLFPRWRIGERNFLRVGKPWARDLDGPLVANLDVVARFDDTVQIAP